MNKWTERWSLNGIRASRMRGHQEASGIINEYLLRKCLLMVRLEMSSFNMTFRGDRRRILGIIYLNWGHMVIICNNLSTLLLLVWDFALHQLGRYSIHSQLFELANLRLFLFPLRSYLPNPSARAGYDTRSVFKQSLTGLNSEFSFS